jgi:MYXO-CTERM domain-containing protein
MKLYQVSQYSDVANLTAVRKRDPDQGRGFMHNFQGLPNPGYRVPNGFMPEVKTFTVSTSSGVVDPTTDNTDSLTFTLVPATWDPNYNTTPGSATPNVPLGPSPTAPKGTPITNPTGPSTGVGSNPGNSSSGGTKTGYGGLGLGSSSGCGCTTAGSDQSSGLAGFGVLGLGFALLGLRRNKKES